MIQQSLAWQNLFAHQTAFNHKALSDLFHEDPLRTQHYNLSFEGLNLDFSRMHVTGETMSLLEKLAIDAHLEESIQAQFAGSVINLTEARQVLHTLLRKPACYEPTMEEAHAEVLAVLQQMQAYCENQLFTDVVHIGIGGSVMGPELVTQALSFYRTAKLKCHFVANIDPAELQEKLADLNPATTLFILASKSFTTEETLCNAEKARQWLQQKLGMDAWKSHFVAVTGVPEKAKSWGLSENAIFKLWDWVGGRYSLWSAIGLPIALSIGMENFKALLSGAHAMDEHFRTAPFNQNMPVVLALLGVWYRNFLMTSSHAIIPYSYALRKLPLYLQQLEMESNGKCVTLLGKTVNYPTAPLIWGSEGTNSQHAYHQWLHQGTDLTPVDFIVAKTSHYDSEQHRRLYANCLVQAQVLCFGDASLDPHRNLPGNRPSAILTVDKLTPRNLGALLALYEHKVFVQGVIWGVNSFDQWGVEAGKAMAKKHFITRE